MSVNIFVPWRRKDAGLTEHRTPVTKKNFTPVALWLAYATVFSVALACNPVVATAVKTIVRTATKLAIRVQPAGTATTGQALPQQPAVQLVDSSGVSVAHSGIPVTAAMLSGGGTLSGSTTVATNDSGLASFKDLAITGTGTQTLRFSANGLTAVDATPVVIVAAPPVARVSVSLNPGSPIYVGSQTRAAATLFDAGGNTLSGTVTWTSTNTAVASISNAGVVTSANTGTTTLTATAANGVSGSTTLTINPYPATALLASSGFEDSTFGPYGHTSTDVDIVNDPTNSGHGKVVRMHYYGTNQDRNRNISFSHNVHLGDTLYFRGDFYIPANAISSIGQISRKLVYWQSANWPYSPQFWSVCGMFGNQASNDNTFSGNYTVNPITRPGYYTFGVWHRLETEVSLGTSLGASDGVFRMWLDGVLVVDESHKQWTDAAWANPSQVMFATFLVGDQTDSTISGISYDEYRYWDNISFSTERLP